VIDEEMKSVMDISNLLKEIKVKKICMILVLCLMTIGISGQDDVDPILLVDIKAKGLDADIPGIVGNNTYTAETLIVGKIEFDEASGLTLGRVEFHLTIYDVSGEKVYSMQGHHEGAPVLRLPFRPCPVRKVTWTDVWFVLGPGKVKTTDVVITEFEYRNQIITLPNTGGKFVPAKVAMMVSPLGKHTNPDGVWPGGGWAFAGIMTSPTTSFGGVTWLTKYVEY